MNKIYDEIFSNEETLINWLSSDNIASYKIAMNWIAYNENLVSKHILDYMLNNSINSRLFFIDDSCKAKIINLLIRNYGINDIIELFLEKELDKYIFINTIPKEELVDINEENLRRMFYLLFKRIVPYSEFNILKICIMQKNRFLFEEFKNELLKRNNVNAKMLEYVEDRSFSPPDKVYKKCLGNVIVEAHIPGDAKVRGKSGVKCRASKAIITNIFGTMNGLSIGISSHDNNTIYKVGDTIEIDDFDEGIEFCSTGFHFFCTREEAEQYEI